MKRVIVHVDWLVLNGVCREDRNTTAQGLREELGGSSPSPAPGRNGSLAGALRGSKSAGWASCPSPSATVLGNRPREVFQGVQS